MVPSKMLRVGCAPSRSSATSVSATNWGETIFCLPSLAIEGCDARQRPPAAKSRARRTKKPEPDSNRLENLPYFATSSACFFFPDDGTSAPASTTSRSTSGLHAVVGSGAAALDEPPRLALGLGELGGDQGVDHGDGVLCDLDARQIGQVPALVLEQRVRRLVDRR